MMRRPLRPLLLLAVVILGFLTYEYLRFRQRNLQWFTSLSMQDSAGMIDNYLKSTHPASRDFPDIYARFAAGEFGQTADAWRNPMVLILREEPDGVHYVLVSTGADGKRDYYRSERYFEAERKWAAGHPKADLIWRDGKDIVDGFK